jgi:hypothetical protein
MARRRHRKHFDKARKLARATNLREWLEGRSKQAKARNATMVAELTGRRVDRRPEWLQGMDGLGGPVLEGEPYGANRALVRSLIGGKSRRVRRVTGSSAVHAAKAPASLTTHVRLRLIERDGSRTDFGRVTIVEAAAILGGAK